MKLSQIGWSWLAGVVATGLVAKRFYDGSTGDPIEMQTERLAIVIIGGFVVVVMSMGAALAVWWTERNAALPEDDES
jgi:hypothetical protein